MKWIRQYKAFFFTPVDARVYAFFRISFPIVLAIHLIHLWIYFDSLFTKEGMIDASHVAHLCKGTFYFSFFHYFHSTPFLYTSLVIAAISVVLLGIGLFSRLAVAYLYLWHLSYLHLVFPVLSGWDYILTTYLFILMISPLGTIWSVEAWMRKTEPPAMAPAYGLYLMRLQLSIIYFSTVLLKLSDPYWQNGEFFSYFMLSVYSRYPATFWAEQIWLSKLFTYSTLVIELLIPLLLFTRRWKWLGILSGFGLHLSIMLTANLTIFSIVMLPLYIPFFNHIKEINKPFTLSKSTQ